MALDLAPVVHGLHGASLHDMSIMSYCGVQLVNSKRIAMACSLLMYGLQHIPPDISYVLYH